MAHDPGILEYLFYHRNVWKNREEYFKITKELLSIVLNILVEPFLIALCNAERHESVLSFKIGRLTRAQATLEKYFMNEKIRSRMKTVCLTIGCDLVDHWLKMHT